MFDPATSPSPGPPTPALRLEVPLGRQECRVIFREMVRAEARIEPLDLPRRRRLVRYALRLGIGGVDADRIITRAVRADGHTPEEMCMRSAARPAWLDVAGAVAGLPCTRAMIMIAAGALLWCAWLIARLT